MGSIKRLPIFFGIAVAVVVFSFLIFTDLVNAGLIHNVDGWAWNGNLGWISVNCEDSKPGYPGGDCAPANGNYGLDIDDTGNLSGWAWSTEGGWICFGATCDGAAGVPAGGTPVEDNFCPANTPCALYTPSDGEFHGWAYVVGSTDSPSAQYRGWMTLNCTDVDPNTASPYSCGVAYSVGFDEGATGGPAQFSGFAWNGNSGGTGVGWTQFACGAVRPCAGLDWGVTSGWVNTGWTSMKQQEGVYSPITPLPDDGSYLTDIPIVFKDFSAPKDSTLRCVIKTSATNGYIDIQWPITERKVLEPEYTPGSYQIQASDAVLDSSGNPVLWSFSSDPDLEPTPFSCEIQATPPTKKVESNTIATHPALFNFTGAGGSVGSDSNRAKFCLDGNLGALDPSRAYFLNTVQCDTEGDLAFTLLKAKGVEVELICDDNIDDEVNLQKDCDGGLVPTLERDRNCRGITYMCITHPVAPSVDPPLP